MFRTIHNIIPCNVSQMFTINRSVHYHNTRLSNTFHYPKVNTQLLFNSLRHNGQRLWNNLPEEIKSSTNITSFKAKLKRVYIEDYLN